MCVQPCSDGVLQSHMQALVLIQCVLRNVREMGVWLFFRTNQLPCFVLVKTCASVDTLTPKSSWERVFFCWTKEASICWALRGRYCARSIISFYLNSHLEGGKGDDTLQMRKHFPVKPVLKSCNQSQTWDSRLRSYFNCYSSFHYTLLTLCVCELLSRVRLSVSPWAVARQAPLSTEFSRQEQWSGLPFPSAGDLPGPGIEPGSPALQVDSLPSEPLLSLM